MSTSKKGSSPMELARTDAARRAIAQATRVDEVKGIRDKAAAVRLYAKQARMGIEMQNNAAEIKLRAERRAGEMLAEMEKSRGGKPARNRSTSATGLPPTLASLGLTKNQSAHWQQLALVPQRRFEAYLAQARAAEDEITTAGVLRAVDANYKHDQHTNRGGDIHVPQSYDNCQTPAYALDPLLPFLRRTWTVWEPAAGEGLLVDGLYDAGFAEQRVVGSDLLTGQNFFEYEPAGWDVIVTNPPFSIKYDWLRRCYELGQPFALLLPVDTLGARTAQDMFRQHGAEIMLLDRRVNFKMPLAGWTGGGAPFAVAWFTWQLNIGAQIVFAHLSVDPRP